MTLRPCYIECLNNSTIYFLDKCNINFVVDKNALLYRKKSHKWIRQYIPHSFTFKDVITEKCYLVRGKKSIIIELFKLSKRPTIHQLYGLSEPDSDKCLKWNLVSCNRKDIQSQINNGYVNITDQTLKLCLPDKFSDKDMVAASGNWTIQLNPNQKVLLSPSQVQSPVYNWKNFGEHHQWIGIGVSIDGNKIVLAAINDYIYVSLDGGIIWIRKECPRFWSTIAISGDGNTIISAVQNGYIYVSCDFGDTWKEGIINGNWVSVTSSIDGKVLAAAAKDDSIYISKDSGNTWYSGNSGKRNWSSLSCSSDGSKLISAVNHGNLFVSIDYGMTWAVKEIDKLRKWTSVSSSYRGTNLVACCSSGHIHLSTDSGHSWVNQNILDNWKLVYITPNGSQIMSITEAGTIYIYTAKEQKWILQTKIQAISWSGIAYSKNNGKFYLSSVSGKLEVIKDYIEINHNFQLSAGMTLQLIYVGNNILMPIYFNGQIS